MENVNLHQEMLKEHNDILLDIETENLKSIPDLFL